MSQQPILARMKTSIPPTFDPGCARIHSPVFGVAPPPSPLHHHDYRHHTTITTTAPPLSPLWHHHHHHHHDQQQHHHHHHHQHDDTTPPSSASTSSSSSSSPPPLPPPWPSPPPPSLPSPSTSSSSSSSSSTSPSSLSLSPSSASSSSSSPSLALSSSWSLLLLCWYSIHAFLSSSVPSWGQAQVSLPEGGTAAFQRNQKPGRRPRCQGESAQVYPGHVQRPGPTHVDRGVPQTGRRSEFSLSVRPSVCQSVFVCLPVCVCPIYNFTPNASSVFLLRKFCCDKCIEPFSH